MELTKKDLKEIVKQLKELQNEDQKKLEQKNKEKHLKRFRLSTKKPDFCKDTIIDILTYGFKEDEGLDEYSNMSMLYHIDNDKYQILKNKTDTIIDIIEKINLFDITKT